MLKLQKTPKQIWLEVDAFLQDAAGEMANDMLSPGSGFLDDEWAKRIAKAKKNGCQDIRGWLGDELYSDSATIADLAGDRIYEACNGDRIFMEKVYAEMICDGGAAAKAAIILSNR